MDLTKPTRPTPPGAVRGSEAAPAPSGPAGGVPYEPAAGAGDAPEQAGPHAHAGRFWSVRRVPAGIVAAVLLGATGLLLYDVSAVRADQPAMRWRRRLADELATRPLDDTWVIAGAAVAMALGLWLLVLAVTPGLRRVLPMRHDGADLRAGLDRFAAGLVLRDRAMEIAGVRSVRVDVGRRKVVARARSHFRDLDEVRDDLDTVLRDGVRRLGLARQPRVSVSVRRPPKG
ncbi:DUF6286 domain-containing protein [Streptomyces sp. XD-27]|uniref:DUF6286 domain-containing protein n=1 Tax=Streptomyces sp. XD-27 TaxID=3062779 RepID=UPI0026F47143|nr:DUF6286 domain-containing protein [Streptomyces sp. XD-27]WKX69666.1 DUF6286 domain-containing protein [Streptomyces sp. XD-27]